MALKENKMGGDKVLRRSFINDWLNSGARKSTWTFYSCLLQTKQALLSSWYPAGTKGLNLSYLFSK